MFEGAKEAPQMAKGPKPYVAPSGTHPAIAAAMAAMYNAYWVMNVCRDDIAKETKNKVDDVIMWTWQKTTPNLTSATAEKVVAWYKKRWPDWKNHGQATT